MAALQGLKLVDPAKASWKQVVEFRKDKNSFKSLRELRVFFQTNYTGKDLSFIIDNLGSRIDKYDDARKMWGFETAQRGISVIFDQKNLVTTSVGSLAAHAAGGTLLTAAAAGAILALGPAALEVSKVWLEGRKAELDNQVRYLANLRKKIGE